MAVLMIECPDCGHTYRTLVVEGTRMPTVWACSECHGRNAVPKGGAESSGHPWANACMDDCCG